MTSFGVPIQQMKSFGVGTDKRDQIYLQKASLRQLNNQFKSGIFEMHVETK